MPIPSSNNSLIARNTVFLYIRMLLVLLISLYTARVILEVLGVDDYGIYNVVAGFVSMFGFLNSSLTACIQRYYNYEGGKNGLEGFRKVFIISSYIEIVLSIVIFCVVEIVGLWYIENKLVLPVDRLYAAKCIFHFSALQLLLLMLQVPYSALILSKEHMDYYALVGILDVILKLIIAILLPYITYDKLILYGFLTLCISILNFLLYFGFVKLKYQNIKLKIYWNKELFKSMLSFSSWNVFGATAMVARTQGVNMLLNSFFGSAINAARGIAFQIQSAMMGFIQNITMAVRPQLTESYAVGNISRSSSLMLMISKVCFIFLYLMVLPISYEINYVLDIWLGDNIPEYTAIFSILVLATALIDVLNTPVTMIVMATGKVSLYCSITSIIGVLVLPLSYIFLNNGFSAEIVFIIGIFISILVQLASLFIMRKETGLSLTHYLREVILPLLTLVVLTVLVPFFIQKYLPVGFFRFVLTILVSISVVLFVSYIICLNKKERVYIGNMIKSLFRR